MNITSFHFKFTTPFCHVLPVHNMFTVNRNKLVMTFCSSFSFRVKHNVAVTVASELCPVIRFLSHTAALPFLEKKFPCIFTELVSLLSECLSYLCSSYCEMFRPFFLGYPQQYTMEPCHGITIITTRT
jgi:hypothetical protein